MAEKSKSKDTTIHSEKKLQLINEKDLIMRNVSIVEIDKIVQCLNEGKFYLFRGADILDFKNSIDWEHQHTHSASTYQVYLHSLDIIACLCHQYRKTKEVWLLEKSHTILNSWLEYDKLAKGEWTQKKPSIKMWYDHPVACRALTITLLYTLSKDVIELDEEVIYNCLVKHAQFLYQDKNYARNNHGIMMDQALILSSIVLAEHKNAQHWKNKAIIRMKEAFNRDFSAKGTHLENSPDYHKLVMNLFIKIEKFLKKNKLTLGENINNRIDLAQQYFQYLLKPDQKIPLLGDSSLLVAHPNKKRYNPFIDIQAGIAIFQHLIENNPEFSTWLSFTCGYGSKTHKHHDDLSFNLFWKGKDIFVDSGKYNYDKKSKYRQYVTSPLAHNTITIEGLSYELDNPLTDRKKITITDFINNSIYDLVKGKNLNYNGREIYRTLIFLKPDIVIIFDKISGNSNSQGLQLFNLAPHIKILETKNNHLRIKSDDEVIEIIPLLAVDNLKIHHGDRETPRGVISQKFASLTDISQVEFSKQGEKLEFLTLIKLGETGVLPDTKYDQTTSQLSIKTSEHQFDVSL